MCYFLTTIRNLREFINFFPMISPAKRAFTETSKIVVCERVSGMREFVLLSGMYWEVVDEYVIE